MRRRITVGLGAVGIVVWGLLAGSAAYAQSAATTLGSTEVEFTPADAGGGSAEITLTNLTRTDLQVTARPQAPPSDRCQAQLNQDGSLPRAQSRTFTATLTAGCGRVDESLGIIVTAGDEELPTVTATVQDTEKPDWNALWRWFVGATLAAAALMLLVAITWPMFFGGTHPFTSLPYLEDSWSFKDSWVSNVTVVGGLLAGIFASSDVLTGVLGEDADEAITLATIGGAVSVALIGAAGVLVIALKNPRSGNFTSIGVLLGSILALGGAAGQLGVVHETAQTLDLGGVEHDLRGFRDAALGLLILYGFLSVLGVLIQGRTEPDGADPVTEPVSETVFSAAVIAASMSDEHEVTRQEVDSILKALEKTTASDGAPPPSAAKAPALQDVARALAVRGSGRAALP
jgi:hypothetical protein